MRMGGFTILGRGRLAIEMLVDVKMSAISGQDLWS